MSLCSMCHVQDGHVYGCPEAGPPVLAQEVAAGYTEQPLSQEEREVFAAELRKKLETNRTTFVVDKWMFEAGSAGVNKRFIETASSEDAPADESIPESDLRQKLVTAAALRIMLDYCESNWPMGFVEYCAGMFQGRLPAPGECAFDLLPDARERVSADRLGLGHIYGGNDAT